MNKQCINSTSQILFNENVNKSVLLLFLKKLWRAWGGGEVQEGGAIRILMGDSRCLVEIDTTL